MQLTIDSNLVLKRGFTLLEMVIVIVIIGILASIAVPRMVGNDRRTFQLTVDRVADLLTMYANRESMGQKAVGLHFDASPGRRWLELMSVDIDDRNPGSAARWRQDPIVKPVKFPDYVTLDEVSANGEIVDIDEWPLASTPGQGRPTIRIVMSGPNGQTTQLVLDANGLAPAIYGTGANFQQIRSPINLDAIGKTREDW
ncbi:MAG TPA: prepilin-type N-terminal cleavage/methylation domain-containing protein [Phycisphaerales bacterium]|nr:prepilin-type N-terminal cleavage/methylation domain-containing protein [Phycisphaerales bacterium]